ncbi:MAG: hypothetical protein PHO08_09240 [Methylococcales bacterium]|nr:hypothetical protein [Methylococcales bacterium]
MTDNTENLALEHLRHIRGRVDLIADDMKEVKSCRVDSRQQSTLALVFAVVAICYRETALQVSLEELTSGIFFFEN